MVLFKIQLRLLFTVATSVLVFPWPATAQSSLSGSPGQAQSSPVAAIEAGVEIDEVRVVISGTTGDAVRDEQLRAAALEASGVTGGDTVSTASLAVSLDRIRALDGVVGADTRLEAGPSGATLLFAVTLGSKPLQAEAAAPAFPVLYGDFAIHAEADDERRNRT